jgi:hypothetical protein
MYDRGFVVARLMGPGRAFRQSSKQTNASSLLSSMQYSRYPKKYQSKYKRISGKRERESEEVMNGA